MGRNPRVQRVAERIQNELAVLIQRRLKDPRAGFLTVTEVEMSPDLKLATVFVSALGEDDLTEGLATLERARGFLRTELGRAVRLRHTPDLRFLPDRSAEHGLRVAKLLDELKRKGELGEGEEE